MLFHLSQNSGRAPPRIRLNGKIIRNGKKGKLSIRRLTGPPESEFGLLASFGLKFLVQKLVFFQKHGRIFDNQAPVPV
jgi:hypothetical protein